MATINHTTLSAEEFTTILEELPEHENLRQVMKWALADETGVFVPGVVSQVIVQDEFSHDVIIPWRDGLTLVYDTTCVGGVTAVAVWDHIPTADDLLATRLQSGWKPIASFLKAGDTILGHAACSVTSNPNLSFDLESPS